MSKNEKRVVWGVLVVACLLAAAFFVARHRARTNWLFQQRKELREIRPKQVNHWSDQLQLSPSQGTAFEKIVDEHDTEMMNVFSERSPDRRKAIAKRADERMEERTLAILNPAQKPVFERLLKQEKEAAGAFQKR